MVRKLKPAFTKPEVMAPAGDAACLKAALDAGADAVYFGLEGTNMRAGAKNFPLRSLGKIVKQCHDAGARAYLTLNNIYYDRELARVDRILDKAASVGLDAVIAWDFGVLKLARDHGVSVYLSTQASVANAQALATLHKSYGVRRFVLARECSLSDIRSIRQTLPGLLGEKTAAQIELEVFVHGAMCVSVSGRCFLSQFQTGHSGNRGECRQPCRRQYKITSTDGEMEWDLGERAVMSPKDLCALPFLDKLLEVGCDSLKIEGCNRAPEYVHTVTHAYRRAVDAYAKGRGKRGFKADFSTFKDELMVEVGKVYNRGFSNGFYLGQPANDWVEGENNQASLRKTAIGRVINYYSRLGVAEIRTESRGFKCGDELVIQGPSTGHLTVPVERIEIGRAEVTAAAKGQAVALKTPRAVRRGDKVFAFIARR